MNKIDQEHNTTTMSKEDKGNEVTIKVSDTKVDSQEGRKTLDHCIKICINLIYSHCISLCT